ncbi:MAG: PAS domain S-box protein [Cyclobacteriaceae bacterium]
MQVLPENNVSTSSSPDLLESLPIAALVIDADGRMERINALACHLFQEKSEYLVGRIFLSGSWKLLKADGSPLDSPETLLVDLLNPEGKIAKTTIGLVTEKQTLWLSVSVNPLYSAEKTYEGAVITLQDVSKNVTGEKKLSRTERRLRSVPEYQTNYIIRTDLEGNFLYLNSAALTQFDHGDEEDVFRSLNYLTDPMYAIECIKAAAYCVDHPGRYRHIEIRCYNKHREYFWTAWELVGITNEEGEVVEIQAVGHDISKRKRTADLLVETSQMAHIGGWEISSLSKRVSWTPETYRIHDVAENSPITLKRAIGFFHPDHQPIIRKALRTLILDGTPFDERLKVITELNRELWVRVIGQRESVHGNYIRSYGVIQDITDSQLSKERIKRREWLLKSVFNSTADALLLVDREHKIIDCNESALRIFEVEHRQDMLGHDGNAFQKNPFLDEDTRMIRKAVDKEGVWTKEVEFVTARNKSFWGSMAITTFPGMDYGVVRVTDITEKKDAENLLLESNQHLKKANEELDRFVYSASHDLRAPLTSIMGLIHLSSLEEMSDPVREYLQHMQKSADRLDNFIKDLTHFSRNARLQITSEPIQFDDMITMLFEQYQYMDYQSPVKTYLNIEQSETFCTDKNRLQIALGNVISNAMKYNLEHAEESYVKVEVKVASGQATITIRDNGMGIDAEHHDKIFDMFSRADNHTPGA